jgi:hypothetical protein
VIVKLREKEIRERECREGMITKEKECVHLGLAWVLQAA